MSRARIVSADNTPTIMQPERTIHMAKNDKKKKGAQEPEIIEAEVIEAETVETTADEGAAEVTALSTEVREKTGDITTLFARLDVQELDSAIQGIADTDHNLSEDEKKYAVEVIKNWNTAVVEAISNEDQRIKEFLQAIRDISYHYKTLMTNPDFEEPLNKLIQIAGLEDKAAALGGLISDVEDAERAVKELDDTPLDIDLELATESEKIDARAKRSHERLTLETKRNKAKRALNAAISEFNRALNGNADVKAALSSLGAFERRLCRSKSTCQTKATAATLAVSINDKDMREKLGALINITIK